MVSRGRSRVAGRSRVIRRGRVRRWRRAFRPSATLRGWLGDYRAQARYSSCGASSTATAAVHRCGRGRGRGINDVGGVDAAWRSLARCRAWRSAAVIGAWPMRCPGMSFSFLLAIVTVTVGDGDNLVSCAANPVSLFYVVPFLRPDLACWSAPRAAAVKTGRRPPPQAAWS